MSCLQPTTGRFPTASLNAPLRELSWFAIQTLSRHEKRVLTELQEKRIDAFLPLFSAVRQWSDRQQIVLMPLFPQYLFVRIEQSVESRISVLRTTGVTGFVGMRGIGLAIPDAEIERVQTVLAEGVSCSPHAFVNVGQRIRIRGGALDGLEGLLTGVNGDHTLVVSVELIQRSLAIQIAGFTVETV